MARVIVPVTEVVPPKATLTTSLTGSNNDLVFTALKRGPIGNNVRIQYIDPGGTTASLSVACYGFDILVSLARAASAIITTANDITAAIAANADAAQLVSIANAGGNDGTGIVTALALTNLAGGALQSPLPSQVNCDVTNGHYFTGNDEATVIEVQNVNVASKTVTIAYGPSSSPTATIAGQVETIPASTTRNLGPFLAGSFNQNIARDVYFDGNVATDLKFRVYRYTRP